MTPLRIDDRADGIVLFRFVTQDGTADVQAADETEAKAKYAAWQAPVKQPPSPSQLAEAIAALKTLDQTKAATIGDVVAALALIGG